MLAPSKESLTAIDSIDGARGVLILGDHATIGRVFGALVDLQPMAWVDDGLLCAPWLDPDRAHAAMDRCPLKFVPSAPPPLVPDTPARMVSGWYRRTDLHAPAPAGLRELVQVAGAGFGPHDHPTTAMCLSSLERLPAGPGVDVGCGSGLLGQAWVALGHAIVGIDADPAAVDQACASMHAAGRLAGWQYQVGRIDLLAPAVLDDAVILANLPPSAHAALVRLVTRPPRAIVLSGTSRTDAAPIVDHYRSVGLRIVRSMHTGRYVCVTLVAP